MPFYSSSFFIQNIFIQVFLNFRPIFKFRRLNWWVLNIDLYYLYYFIIWKQAWNSTTYGRMVRWTFIGNTMSNSNKSIIHIQFHNHRTKRNSLMACSHFMVKSNNPWTYYHPPKAQSTIPISKTPQRSHHHTR